MGDAAEAVHATAADSALQLVQAGIHLEQQLIRPSEGFVAM